MVPPATPTSYYGRPILKAPVWKWMIPAYFFTGGLSAGSALLAWAGRRRGNETLARRGNLVAVASVGVSGGLLVADLGKPERFLNMLRVAKPTSPMSMGTWLLTVYGPSTGVATLSDLTGRLPRVGRAAESLAALLAPLVATYTAVLVADTAVPVWHEAGADLPFVFASGAAISAGGVLLALVGPQRAGVAKRMALLGAASELAAMNVMQTRLGELGDVYHEERAGEFARWAKRAITAGAVTVVVAGRRRGLNALGGLMMAGGAACERFAVVEAGMQSARNPQHTVGPQRSRLSQNDAQSATLRA
jgi:formate-dependent nitrite reductase membrane component NrfD